jgi:hypothetical protein
MTVEVIKAGKVMYHGDHRYRPEIELQMLESGYTVKVDGRRITLAEARKRASAAGKKR